ncbi:MAG: orotate phosphoribosyltransferase [Hyphomicrobiales bacterium]
MNEKEIFDKFIEAKALLEGHFVLSSGLHSAKYIQCARVMMFPEIASQLCGQLANMISQRFETVDMIVSPAMGGVIVGYEVARQLKCPAVFFERVDGNFTLRRGFEIEKGQRCLMVEDIVTTGLSSRECISAINQNGGEVIGAACLIDRSGGTADVGVDLVSLAKMQIETFKDSEIPDWLNALPISKPGSRNLK